jgi:hypothetical protein
VEDIDIAIGFPGISSPDRWSGGAERTQRRFERARESHYYLRCGREDGDCNNDSSSEEECEYHANTGRGTQTDNRIDEEVASDG